MEWKHLLAIVVGLAAIFASSASGDQTHEEPQSVAAACAATSADVTWAAVQNSHLSGYDVYHRMSGVGDYAKANTGLVTQTQYTVTELSFGVSYEFRVVAVYADGQASAMSAPAICTTG